MKYAFVTIYVKLSQICCKVTILRYTLVPLFHPVNNWKYRFNVVMSINLYTLQNLVQN